MSNPLQFSVELGKNTPARRPSRGEPLRILYLTDLGESCNSRQADPFETRPIRQIDIDTIDTLIEDEQPSIDLPAGRVELREIDDLHPDQLCLALPVFQNYRGLRQRLNTPASFEAAAAEVRGMMTSEPEAPAAPENDSDTLARLLGGASTEAPKDTPMADQGFLANLLQEAVAAHITPAADPRAEEYTKAVDAAAAAQLRAVLHDPAFQAFESAWRGLDMLVSNVETDEDISIHVMNASKLELAEAMGAADAPLDQSVLHRRLVEQRENSPFTMIVTDMLFGSASQDVRLLATLGALIGRQNGLVVAGLEPDMLGATSWHALAEAPETLTEVPAGWSDLRATPMGRHILAMAPGVMLRLPYGKRLEKIDPFAFEEIEAPGAADAPFLWGSPALIGAILIAQSFAEDGWDATLNSTLEYDDLPLVPYDDQGEPAMKPCAEAVFSDRSSRALLDAGPVPLLAPRNANAVRLPWFQTISSNASSDRLGPFQT